MVTWHALKGNMKRSLQVPKKRGPMAEMKVGEESKSICKGRGGADSHLCFAGLKDKHHK